MSESRSQVFTRALESAVGVGTDDLGTLFTDDVQGWSPTLNVSSLAELKEALQDRDDALANVTLAVQGLNMFGNKGAAEWRVEADHVGELTVTDELKVDATGRHVHMGGATFAEFRGDKIRSFRTYFDDMALLE